MRYFDLIYCLEGLVILAKEKKMVEEITSMSEGLLLSGILMLLELLNLHVILILRGVLLLNLMVMLYGKICKAL